MEPWILPVVALIFVLAVSFGRNQVVRRRLACPTRAREATIDVVQRYRKPDHPVRVRSCTLLADPQRVDCGQECLRFCV